MRSLLTALLMVVFVPSFVAFFLLGAVLGYSRDTDAVVETARAADSREVVVELVHEQLYRELSSEPRLSQLNEDQLRTMVERVVSQEWFEGALRSAHEALVSAIESAEGTAVIELGDTKERLQTAARGLAERARDECSAVFGPRACSDPPSVNAAVETFVGRADRAIDEIPDRLDVFDDLDAARRAELEEVRERLATARMLRWVALGALGVCLLLIAMVNRSSMGRALGACGGAVAIGAVMYFVTTGVATGAAERVVTERTEETRREHGTGDRLEGIAERGAERFGLELVDRATGREDGTVMVVGIIGLGAAVAGFAMSRGRR